MKKRMYNIREAAEYIGMGKTKARVFLEQIGAKWQVGRIVRYDIRVIDQYFNNERKQNEDHIHEGV